MQISGNIPGIRAGASTSGTSCVLSSPSSLHCYQYIHYRFGKHMKQFWAGNATLLVPLNPLYHFQSPALDSI